MNKHKILYKVKNKVLYKVRDKVRNLNKHHTNIWAVLEHRLPLSRYTFSVSAADRYKPMIQLFWKYKSNNEVLLSSQRICLEKISSIDSTPNQLSMRGEAEGSVVPVALVPISPSTPCCCCCSCRAVYISNTEDSEVLLPSIRNTASKANCAWPSKLAYSICEAVKGRLLHSLTYHGWAKERYNVN